MGFFSWECAKTRLPILNEYTAIGNYAFANRVVVLFKDGGIAKGNYDGYGRVRSELGVIELVEMNEKDWRMVIERFYEGEHWSAFKVNHNDPGQGHFYDEDDLHEIFELVMIDA